MTRIAETPHMDAVLKSLTPGEIGVIASVLDEDYGDDDMVDELTTAFMQEEVAVIDGEYPPAVADMQERLAYHIVHILKRVLPVSDPVDNTVTGGFEPLATVSRDPENVAVKQSRDDAARAIVEEEFENWSHKELVDNIIDRMSLKEIEEFASDTTAMHDEFVANN